MPKYKIYESEEVLAVWTYIVEAETLEEAEGMVINNEVDPDDFEYRHLSMAEVIIEGEEYETN